MIYFWCFYLIHLGFYKYETIHNYFTEEKNVKIGLVTLIRQHKDILNSTNGNGTRLRMSWYMKRKYL